MQTLQTLSEAVDSRSSKIIQQKVGNILKGNKMAGVVASINGNTANVYVNGSDTLTTNIPIRYGLIVAVNDEVWIERINFSDIDLQITSKRVLDNTNWISWTSAVLGNSWVNTGGLYYNAEYKLDANGFVHLRGVIKSGMVGSTAFTLPVGCRPSKKVPIPTISYNGSTYIIARVDISNTGTVVPVIGSNNEFYLDNIMIPAEQ